MEYKFKAEGYHNLALHKEFSIAYNDALLQSSLVRIFLTLLILWYLSYFHLSTTVIFFLIYALSQAVSIYRTNKLGDAAYRRMLTSNGGKIQHTALYFRDTDILEENLDFNSEIPYYYDQFLGLIETKNLLILTMPDMLAQVFSKETLSGGTVEEFKAWIFEKCPNIKKKRPLNQSFGKWVRRIYYGVMITGVLIGLLNFPGFSIWDRVTGRLHNGLSYLEMAQELKPLGISISADTIDDMELYDRDYVKEFGTDYYSDNPDASKVQDLIYWEAAGIWDPETEEWTPSTSGIFWYDLEVMYVDTMYEDLLTGLSAMAPSLEFYNVQTDFSKADHETGTGTVTVSFDYQDDHYSFEALYDYDWLDMTILFGLMDIFHQDEWEEDLYYAYDGQGVYLYYNTKSQVSALERKTGLDFYNTASGFGF